jgi:DNA-binding NarL/FixJ family response regulator
MLCAGEPDRGRGAVTKQIPIRVLIVDNQTLLRHGIKLVLQAAPDIEVVGEAVNSAEAIERATTLAPDVVLIESALPDRGGIAAIRTIKHHHPDVRILVLSAHGDSESFGKTAAAGAIGYILKDISPENLMNAIRAAHTRRTMLSPTIAQQIVKQMFVMEPPAGDRNDRGQTRRRDSSLGEQDVAVLRGVAHGFSDKEIAAQLFLSESAVKTRLRHLYRKLGLKNRAHAAVFALERGLLGNRSAS